MLLYLYGMWLIYSSNPNEKVIWMLAVLICVEITIEVLLCTL